LIAGIFDIDYYDYDLQIISKLDYIDVNLWLHDC